MKFAKGIIWGSLITAGIIAMCTDNDIMNINTKRITKRGKRIAKRMGII